MMKFSYLLAILLVVLSACTEETQKPNIIFLFADDQTFSTIGELGNSEVITPTLDKMVAGGVTFTHTYNMGAWNGAVCAASRAMLNTGRSVWRAYQLEGNQDEAAERGEFWSQLLQKAGYETYMTGKWHVKTHPDKLFEHVTHVRPGMPKDFWSQRTKDSMPHGYNRPQSKQDTTWLPWDINNGGFWEGGKHWSEVLADDAVSYINEAKTKDAPFFMYLAFNAPHDPRQSPKEFVEMYQPENLSVPQNFLPEYPYKDSIGCGPGLRDAALLPFPRTNYAVQVQKQEYFALITHLDQQIARILKALEESGEMDNTYIFYSADNGMSIGEHGLAGKQDMYENSMRVPLIVIGPDVPKNKRKDVDVYLQDIMATTLDLAGVDKPEYVEFNSLMPFVKNEREESFYPAIYGCYKHHMQRMIRKDGFKLIVYPHGKVMRLFDVNTDPLEMTDLADNPEFAEKKQQLFNDLLALQKEMDDPLDLEILFN
ncbi:sulfatase-like hydrolase/transferase [uncultured Draconibacterium sp.]|uniref:sulfatase-like hydrolase/transferase n=1 Tax=uncultured Draconibacterium sp. TaxID=1573823 RepID=UPI0025E5F9B3|nr:sulfatase-like hydrolase/transferase [uncultured Draconibacterium sp.]